MQGLNQRPKVPVIGTASLNLAEFASVVDQKDFDLNIPLTIPGGSAVEPSPSLSVCPYMIFHSLFNLFMPSCLDIINCFN